MKKTFTIIAFTFLSLAGLRAQIGFEEFPLAPESEWNGSDLTSNNITVDPIIFPTIWDTAFGGYWAGGFALSNHTDTITSGFTNMYSAKAGSGFDGSSNYLVAYGETYFKSYSGWPFDLSRFYITNTTYAYNSMRDGDQFAKKFGGPDGTDPDFFSVTFHLFWNDVFRDSLTFYLADFRSSDPAEDYIIRDWTLVDFTNPGASFADSVHITFASSDTGMFGINTPLYFALDYITAITYVNATNDTEDNDVAIYPNPARDIVHVATKATISAAELLGLDGKVIRRADKQNTLETSDLASGLYWIRTILNDGSIRTNKVVIQH